MIDHSTKLFPTRSSKRQARGRVFDLPTPSEKPGNVQRVLIVAALLAVLTILAGCGRGQATESHDPQLVAEVASFDLNAERPGRFIVGLFAADRREVAMGEVDVSFEYLAPLDGSGVTTAASASPAAVTAAFLALPGSIVNPSASETATFEPPGGVRGVYGTGPIEFSVAGFWQASVTANVDGQDYVATAAFEVRAESLVPGPGDPAPQTAQPLFGAPDVEPKAIDSRLDFADELVDPGLHNMTIADAIAAGRPQLIVIATPVFCVSRFCGPIIDEIARLQTIYGSVAEFVHLEVWADFEANRLNDAAVEWIAPIDLAEAAEPWVFLVDGDGVIARRWDNVASTNELVDAIESVTGS